MKMFFFKVFFCLQVLLTGNLKGIPSPFQNQTPQIRQLQDLIIMQFFRMKWNNSRVVTFYQCPKPPGQTPSSINNTSYVYHNDILCTLFNLQAKNKWVNKARQHADNKMKKGYLHVCIWERNLTKLSQLLETLEM